MMNNKQMLVCALTTTILSACGGSGENPAEPTPTQPTDQTPTPQTDPTPTQPTPPSYETLSSNADVTSQMAGVGMNYSNSGFKFVDTFSGNFNGKKGTLTETTSKFSGTFAETKKEGNLTFLSIYEQLIMLHYVFQEGNSIVAGHIGTLPTSLLT